MTGFALRHIERGLYIEDMHGLITLGTDPLWAMTWATEKAAQEVLDRRNLAAKYEIVAV